MDRQLALAMICFMLASCDNLPWLPNDEENATQACEERLKPSLTTPAAYERLWSRFTPAGPLTREEMISKNEEDRLRAVSEGNDAAAYASAYINTCFKNPDKAGCREIVAMSEKLASQPTAFILIEYESANAFNAVIPGYYSCRTNISEDGSYDAARLLSSGAVPRKLGDRLKAQAEAVK